MGIARFVRNGWLSAKPPPPGEISTPRDEGSKRVGLYEEISGIEVSVARLRDGGAGRVGFLLRQRRDGAGGERSGYGSLGRHGAGARDLRESTSEREREGVEMKDLSRRTQ